MFLWLNVWFIILTYSVTCAEVLIDSDGGYTNVIIGINPEVPDSKLESLLLELEVLFKNTSKLLQTATRGQTFFKEIVFALPRRFRSALSNRNLTTGGQFFRNPDIIVTSGDVFSNPYALQNDGCGRPGLRIHLPEEFILSKGIGKERALVQEWVKHRYGVFDESGFVGDDLYPACYTVPGSEEIKVTDCTDKAVTYDFRKRSPEFPDSCNPVPVGETSHVTSSLMSKTDFPKVSHFCDNELYPHNRNAPSKQNAMCREQSTWKIISQHRDFKFKPIKNSKTIANGISFKYVVEPDFRIIIAADTSNNMAENDRLDMVSNAFSYFVLYNLPENSVVGVKNLKNKESNPLLVTVRSPSDAERLIDAFPEAYGEGSVCIHCGIEQALQTLKMNSAVSQGEIVIISATDVDETHVKGLESALSKNEASLHVIYFKKRLKEAPLLQKLAIASGGRFFYIPDEFIAGYAASSLTLIYEAFRSIYESSSWMNRNHVLVDQATFLKDSCSTCSMSFKIDRSIENFQVLLTGPEFVVGPPVIKEKTILSNGNQDFAPGHSSFSYKKKIPAYVFSIKNPKPGTWSLTFERKPIYNKPLVVIVRSSSPKNGDIIHMHSWINIEGNFEGIMPKRPPITFYSEVKKGHLPVFNATVTASLYRPDTGDDVTMDLNDGGDGDPDITGRDGIFSRYFSEVLQSGYYILTLTAEGQTPQTHFGNSVQGLKASQCCGSSFPAKLAYDAGPFKRVVTYGSFYLSATDLPMRFPPRRIVDLRVDNVLLLNNKVTYVLYWTAPGNNYDYGTAIDYQMRVFNDRVNALTNFEAAYVLTIDNFYIHGQMLEPSIAGSPQSVILELKNLTSGTYYLGIRTMNSAGKFSDVSNVVEVSYTAPIIQPDGSTSSPFTDDPTSTTETNPDDPPVTLSSGVGLAIGLTCGILFIFLVIGLFLFVYCSRSRKDRKKEEAMRQRVISRYGGAPSFLNDDVQKTESSDALCQSTNAMNIAVISPVNSWPANSLLSHYETLKRDKNSDISETSTVPKDASETVSMVSSKYSYVNRVDQNTSLYDPIYFPAHDRENVNYPFNPSYTPFNPTYTSSLRRNRDDAAGNSYIATSNYAGDEGRMQQPFASLRRNRDDGIVGYSPIANGTSSNYAVDEGNMHQLYASSLRRNHNDSTLGNDYYPNGTTVYDYAPQVEGLQPAYTSSLRRHHDVGNGYISNNTLYNYTPEGGGRHVLGTDL